MAASMMLGIGEIADIFDDLERVPQPDAEDPVCAINYPTSYVIAHDYLRACWKTGEHSLRALKLSATCLKLNPANYTVWHWRRVCMDKLGYFDDAANAKEKILLDLTLAEQLGGGNPKNYQIWYHRRALLDAFDQLAKKGGKTSLEADFGEAELDYIASVFEIDAKNYHAWSHRQWLIRTINRPHIWEQELEYGTLHLQRWSLMIAC